VNRIQRPSWHTKGHFRHEYFQASDCTGNQATG